MLPHMFALMMGLVLQATGSSTNPIQWSGNYKSSIAEAQRVQKPLLFYVRGSDDDGGESDLEDAQELSFRDPIVVAIAEQRFVPVRLLRTNVTLQMLAEMGAPTSHGNYLVAATPDGQRLGTISPVAAARPRTLAAELTALFRKYRNLLFKDEVQPVLEDRAASDAKLRTALQTIRNYIIVDADRAVIALLERPGLDRKLRQQVFQTLAALSTPPAVEALFERGLGDRLAAEALLDCTPAGAEELIEELDPEKPERCKLAYKAITRVCNISSPRPDRFWMNADQEARTKEIDRVKDKAHDVVLEWRKQYEHLR